MHAFFKGWRRKAGCAALIVCGCALLFWGRSSEDSGTENLTDASPEIVAKAIGKHVEVEGTAVLDKEGEAIRAANFSALVESGPWTARHGARIHVTGVLQANDPQHGYSYRIIAATCHVIPSPMNSLAKENSILARLVSRNKAPNLPDFRSRPSVDASFDWSEQTRVWNQINELCQSAVDEWDSLIMNIDNEAYCITVNSFSGSYWNWTVGDVCRIVVARTLAESYYPSLTPESLDVYRKIRTPEFALDPEMLKRWLDKRRGKSIAQLQADTCDWAIEELTKGDDEERDRTERDDEDRDRWITTIRKTADTLRQGGTPIVYEGFTGEEFLPCDSQDVATGESP